MTKHLTQRDYWNSRAAVWDSYDVPLIPDQDDVDFMRKHVVPGGHTLILGVTPQLCSLALEVSDKVTAVDFAQNIIEALRIEGVEYICADWFEFFEKSSEQFSTILTDGGLVCLDFPADWQRLVKLLHEHLAPGGIFSARVYLSIPEPPQANYKNPNLERFVTSMGNVDANWMVHPKHGDYAKYDMRYAFPPESEVLRAFEQFTLQDKRVPAYEEGSRFVSYAWGKP